MLIAIVRMSVLLWLLGASMAATPSFAAQPATAYTTPQATVERLLDMGTGYNLRQRAIRDAWLPLFLSPEDCDRMMILLARKVAASSFADDVLRGWRLLEMDQDDSFGFARATVRLRGRNDWWWPKHVDVQITLKKVENRWLIKGPELKNIDLQEPQGD